MVKIVLSSLWVIATLTFCADLFAQTEITFNKYQSNAEVQKALNDLQQRFPARLALHRIADSPGGEPVHVLEIGKDLKNVPAVFVGANFEGKTPISTAGAL